MKSNKGKMIMFLVIIACVAMYIVESIIAPEYAIKSIAKMIVFSVCIICYCYFYKDKEMLKIFKYRNKKEAIVSVSLGVGVFTIILVAAYIAQSFIDFNVIKDNLLSKENISADNFIYIMIYISIINSLLEETVFRGFAFIELRKYVSEKFAYAFSSLAFGIYHIAIMSAWFSPVIFILILFSLVVAGVIFNYLDKKGSIYNSWIVHMSANLGINTVALFMFGIL